MQLNINKDEARIISCALIYYLKQGAIDWYKIEFPNADLECVFKQLDIIEEVED